MRAYTYNTGETVVFINDEKVILTDNQKKLFGEDGEVSSLYGYISSYLKNEKNYHDPKIADIIKYLDSYKAEFVTIESDFNGEKVKIEAYKLDGNIVTLKAHMGKQTFLADCYSDYCKNRIESLKNQFKTTLGITI